MLSKEKVNRCGDLLRNWWRDTGELVDEGDFSEAFQVLWSFRSGFQYPMQKTAVGLRSFVHRESDRIVVAQRLKRLPQIIHKLDRMPKTKLARMEDIGGCRAILRDRGEIDGVMRRIRRNWDVKRERDYIAEPKPSGYRGVHVVIERDHHRVEVQLRTPGQQDWAENVERWAGRYRLPLKDEQGPDEVLQWLRMAADGIAADELGARLPVDFRREFAEARRAVRRWVQEREQGASR